MQPTDAFSLFPNNIFWSSYSKMISPLNSQRCQISKASHQVLTHGLNMPHVSLTLTAPFTHTHLATLPHTSHHTVITCTHSCIHNGHDANCQIEITAAVRLFQCNVTWLYPKILMVDFLSYLLWYKVGWWNIFIWLECLSLACILDLSAMLQMVHGEKKSRIQLENKIIMD